MTKVSTYTFIDSHEHDSVYSGRKRTGCELGGGVLLRAVFPGFACHIVKRIVVLAWTACFPTLQI